ncbi:MAG TPA: hypothetical protein VI728_03575 [Syntrophales bacterium]|nr:MAG: hypothetical protein A2Z28_05530 [Chloroflexi bacterium RBG_16_51_9]HLE17347.1 hypothetical protein [Syntrophales bacterium]
MLESQQVGTKHLREGGQVVWDYSPPGVLRLPIESGWSRNDSLFGWQLRSDFQREDTSAFTAPARRYVAAGKQTRLAKCL